MTLWLSALPSAFSFVALILFWCLVALAAMWVGRGVARRSGIDSGPTVVNAFATCIGALTALLFAFTVITLWNQDTRAQSNVDDEAGAMRLAARDIAPKQLPVLKSYLVQTIAEWPQLCGGRQSDSVSESLYALERSATPRDPRYSDNLFSVLGTLEDMRNRRWQVSKASVPDEVWVALFVLSMVLVTVLAIAMPDRPGVHLILMLGAGTTLGTLFWVTTVLEYPFCGSGGITPAGIVAILRSHVM